MRESLTRRRFLGLAGAGLALPYVAPLLGARPVKSFRIRAITAGVPLSDPIDLGRLEAAITFLGDARDALQSQGYEVQTVRAATQPLAEFLPDWSRPAGLDALVAMDELAVASGISLSVGPVITDTPDPRFGPWAVELVRRTRSISFSARVASPERGVHRGAARSAAEVIEALGRETAGGEGNFRFAAAAFVPAGTPFFPAGWFAEPRTFSIGLESPTLLGTILSDAAAADEARPALAEGMEAALAEVIAAADGIAQGSGWRFLGVDASPAPGLDASIGEVVEGLSGVPFGDPSTLSACALLTDVLKGLRARTCGYSGLMLPVLEDPVLARRAGEGRFGVGELLLYSTVCGTGLDVVPLPGDTPVDVLEGLVLDVASLATKYAKALSARLLPIPGKRAGEVAEFDNPYLTDAAVMDAG